VGRYWGGGMWSLAVYKGKLFMGYNNGGRGTVLAICVGCLSLKCLIRFWAWLPTVFIWWRCCGVWGSFRRIANVHVYDGENVFLISRWDEFGASVQKVVVCPFPRASNN